MYILCCIRYPREEEAWTTSDINDSDSTLRVFSTIDGSPRHSLLGHTSRIWNCSTSPSGSLLASGSGDGDIRIWSPMDGACRTILRGDGGDVYGVTWRPDGEVCHLT